MNNRKWDGTTATTIQAHIERCRESYVDCETASLHVPYQVPIERTRVQSLPDSMDGCTDPKVCAKLAAISNEVLDMLNVFGIDSTAHRTRQMNSNSAHCQGIREQ